MSTLPTWMYGDPADVAERKEQGELARLERERRRKYGNVGDSTVRWIKRLRLREIVAAAKGGKR